MDLTFNIVYTTGTVKYLQLIVFSLLKRSGYSFRLVANACSPEEVRLLQKLSCSSPRLDFLVAPSKTIMRHGAVLDYLQSLEHSDYFCFMDSDILATGDFSSEVSPYLSQYAGVFSGRPLWCMEEEQTLPETLPSIPGHCNRTANGICLGSSYFAIYDNRILTQFIQSTGIGLARYQWSAIPAPYQSQLIDMGLKRTRYDTGKLLNILLAAQGTPAFFLDSTSLQHIGGVSAQTARRSSGRLRKKIKSTTWLPVVKLKQWSRKLARVMGARKVDEEAMTAELRQLQTRRRRSAAYFHRLFDSLFENRPLPAIPRVGDPGTEEKIESAAENIVSLYEEFGEQLA
jgi:hypothetical protein